MHVSQLWNEPNHSLSAHVASSSGGLPAASNLIMRNSQFAGKSIRFSKPALISHYGVRSLGIESDTEVEESTDMARIDRTLEVETFSLTLGFSPEISTKKDLSRYDEDLVIESDVISMMPVENSESTYSARHMFDEPITKPYQSDKNMDKDLDTRVEYDDTSLIPAENSESTHPVETIFDVTATELYQTDQHISSEILDDDNMELFDESITKPYQSDENMDKDLDMCIEYDVSLIPAENSEPTHPADTIFDESAPELYQTDQNVPLEILDDDEVELRSMKVSETNLAEREDATVGVERDKSTQAQAVYRTNVSMGEEMMESINILEEKPYPNTKIENGDLSQRKAIYTIFSNSAVDVMDKPSWNYSHRAIEKHANIHEPGMFDSRKELNKSEHNDADKISAHVSNEHDIDVEASLATNVNEVIAVAEDDSTTQKSIEVVAFLPPRFRVEGKSFEAIPVSIHKQDVDASKADQKYEQMTSNKVGNAQSPREDENWILLKIVILCIFVLSPLILRKHQCDVAKSSTKDDDIKEIREEIATETNDIRKTRKAELGMERKVRIALSQNKETSDRIEPSTKAVLADSRKADGGLSSIAEHSVMASENEFVGKQENKIMLASNVVYKDSSSPVKEAGIELPTITERPIASPSQGDACCDVDDGSQIEFLPEALADNEVLVGTSKPFTVSPKIQIEETKQETDINTGTMNAQSESSDSETSTVPVTPPATPKRGNGKSSASTCTHITQSSILHPTGTPQPQPSKKKRFRFFRIRRKNKRGNKK